MPSRSRSTDRFPDHPSPYRTGDVDHWITNKMYAPLETNRGCPYGCTFCD
jgi:radical SAM superfamily enzyme YgiQ (UPF0313 family)